MATTSRRTPKASKSARDSSGKWNLVRTIVKEHSEQLQAMQSHGEFYAFAKEHDLNTTSLFPKFKSELWKQLDVSYDNIRANTLRARAEEIHNAAESGPQVTLYAHGDAEVDAFAVCTEDGENAWYGEFHADERDYHHDQLSADRCAAGKAVYLAGQVRQELELPAIKLVLCTPNHAVSVEDLAGTATRSRVAVTIEVTDHDNPAIEVVRLPGWQSWRELRLRDLIDVADVDQQHGEQVITDY